MKLSIIDRNCEMSDETREFAERRFLFALSRFDSKIARVSIVVTDTNGPRGGIDKVCQVVIKTRRLGEIYVTGEDSQIEACVARTADRAARSVARAIGRNQQFQRQRIGAATEVLDPEERRQQ